MSNITYLFGAGASYHACPIWQEQADKMIELPKRLDYNFTYRKGENNNFPDDKNLIWLIGDIGTKAKEFNTVDTYAKKLFLQKNIIELNKLKAAVSCFFTIWDLTNNTNWKHRIKNEKQDFFSDIDYRYTNLLATYLEKGEIQPKLKENIKFITWNYDLQIENAYLKFTDIDKDNFDSINKYISFIPSEKNENLNVCHINGFSGLFGEHYGENFFGRTDKKDISSIVKAIDFVIPGLKQKGLNFNNFINYAWEVDSQIAQITRGIAIKTINKTNVLVIIGYSFPPFNFDIDKELFKDRNNLERVIIQDPNADAKFFSETFGVKLKKISEIKNVNQFYIPNYNPSIEKPLTISIN